MYSSMSSSLGSLSISACTPALKVSATRAFDEDVLVRELVDDLEAAARLGRRLAFGHGRVRDVEGDDGEAVRVVEHVHGGTLLAASCGRRGAIASRPPGGGLGLGLGALQAAARTRRRRAAARASRAPAGSGAPGRARSRRCCRRPSGRRRTNLSAGTLARTVSAFSRPAKRALRTAASPRAPTSTIVIRPPVAKRSDRRRRCRRAGSSSSGGPGRRPAAATRRSSRRR